MADAADWSRLSVLLVDDSEFMISLISGVLRNLGITRIATAQDGREAVEVLTTMDAKPLETGVSMVDLVISDIIMPGVDGHTLLRWVRTSPKSPDRFIPFIMCSAAADIDQVEQAREHGTTEFFVKPFNAKAVADRIAHVVTRPRQFVLTKTYFGPDRRRNTRPVSQDLRTATEDDVDIVYSGGGPRNLSPDSKAVLFRLSNRLQDKLGGQDLKGRPLFDPAVIEAADNRIQNMAGDYADWVAKSVQELTEATAALSDGSAADAAATVARINVLANEFRGQGGMFGYPLMTRLGKSLYETTRSLDGPVVENHAKLMRAHVDAITLVVGQKIKGSGGPVGRDLLQSLELAKEKYRVPGALAA